MNFDILPTFLSVRVKQSNRSSQYFWIAVIYTLLLAVFLLAPFNFHVPVHFERNNVQWVIGNNGIEFTSSGIIRSFSSLDKLYNSLVSGTGLTLEVWASTRSTNQKGPARIVSYSLDKFMRNFTLGQDFKALVTRLRTTNTDLGGKNPEIRVEDIFSSLEPQHIVVTYDYFTEIVYINGRQKIEADKPGGRFSNWNSSYSLVIGNELTGNRPWVGRLFLAAIYDRPLSEEEIWKNYRSGGVFDSAIALSNGRVTHGLVVLYLFTEGKGDLVLDKSGKPPLVHLRIPEKLQIAEQEFFSRPYRDFVLRFLTFKQIVEMIGNVIIFIPIGFFFHAAIKHRYRSSLQTTTFVFVLGTLFTLSIELSQYFLETRISSMTDVVNNMMGTAIGTTSEKLYIHYKNNKKKFLSGIAIY